MVILLIQRGQVLKILFSLSTSRESIINTCYELFETTQNASSFLGVPVLVLVRDTRTQTFHFYLLYSEFHLALVTVIYSSSEFSCGHL